MISREEYKTLVEQCSPNSKMWRNLLRAFLVGGAICAIGQGFRLLYTGLAVPEEDAAALTSISLILIGVFLTALGIYDKIAKFAGAGTLVPITGFANSVASPAIEFKTEGFVLGMAAKLFVISGPVIVFGVTASVIYGVILLFLR